MYIEDVHTYRSLIGKYDLKSSRKRLKLDERIEKYKEYLKGIMNKTTNDEKVREKD